MSVCLCEMHRMAIQQNIMHVGYTIVTITKKFQIKKFVAKQVDVLPSKNQATGNLLLLL